MAECCGKPILAKGLCQTCYARTWYQANKKLCVARLTARRARDREKYRALFRKYGAKRRALYGETPWFKAQARNAMLKHKYNLTLGAYEAMLNRQGNTCAICERAKQVSFAVDHCHKTGRVRGLLCNLCNAFRGVVDRDRTVLDRLMRYA